MHEDLCWLLSLFVDVTVRGPLAASSGVEFRHGFYADGVRCTFKKGTTQQQMILNHGLVYTPVRT